MACKPKSAKAMHGTSTMQARATRTARIMLSPTPLRRLSASTPHPMRGDPSPQAKTIACAGSAWSVDNVPRTPHRIASPQYGYRIAAGTVSAHAASVAPPCHAAMRSTHTRVKPRSVARTMHERAAHVPRIVHSNESKQAACRHADVSKRSARTICACEQGEDHAATRNTHATMYGKPSIRLAYKSREQWADGPHARTVHQLMRGMTTQRYRSHTATAPRSHAQHAARVRLNPAPGRHSFT